MTPEGKVKERVAALLKDAGAWYFKPVSNGMGAHGIPDFVGCSKGRFFGAECKAGKGQLTSLQAMQGAAIEIAGGEFFIPTDIDNYEFERLEQWLKN